MEWVVRCRFVDMARLGWDGGVDVAVEGEEKSIAVTANGHCCCGFGVDVSCSNASIFGSLDHWKSW